jgi:hypothetical protein
MFGKGYFPFFRIALPTEENSRVTDLSRHLAGYRFLYLLDQGQLFIFFLEFDELDLYQLMVIQGVVHGVGKWLRKALLSHEDDRFEPVGLAAEKSLLISFQTVHMDLPPTAA